MHNHQQSDSPERTTRFTHAVEYVRQVHTGFRKGTQVPYMAHLLGVASLVLGETGHVAPITVTEDMVIAALLHNAVEDEVVSLGCKILRHSSEKRIGEIWDLSLLARRHFWEWLGENLRAALA
jgi:(p)ppGpp synthase/HD superfamily hydrolase